MFEVVVQVGSNYSLFRPVGDLDALTATELLAALTDVGGSSRLLIDLSASIHRS